MRALYNLILLPLGGHLYLKGQSNPTLTEAALTGLIWDKKRSICTTAQVEPCPAV